MKLKRRQFVGEETKHTVSGRMGSGQFEYEVGNAEGYRKHVKVKGAQISFFMYTFEDEHVFNSCTLVKQKDYIVAHDIITKYDIDAIAKNANQFVEEPEVPFPQADSFERVVDRYIRFR